MNRILFLLSILSILGCNQKDKNKTEAVEIVEVEPVFLPKDDFDYDTLKGIYTGDFGGSQIRIILNYVSATKAIGYNIHKGLQRNINGKVYRSADSTYLSLSEPGDHEFDGVFNLTFIGIDKSPKGMWVSNSGELKPKELLLTKIESPPIFQKDITTSNFSNFFGYMYDAKGNYSFEEDGFCVYEFYPSTDDINRVEQLRTVKGTWSLSKDILTVEWEENSVFESRTMKYLVGEIGNAGGVLMGETDTLNAYYF